jgi:hypothetical protein
MSRETRTGQSAKVVTANALIAGDVVYLEASGGWTGWLSQAQVFTEAEAAEAALAQATAQADVVVGCYLADVRLTEHGPEPTHFREAFRRRGPSNYAHGKQAAA